MLFLSMFLKSKVLFQTEAIIINFTSATKYEQDFLIK